MGKTDLALRGVNINDLPDKHRKFLVEYVKDYNATRAAKACGYKHPSQYGKKLLTNTKVARAIGAIQRKNLETALLTKDEILQELSNLAMRDIIDLCDEEGVFRIDDMRKIPPTIRRCIESFEVEQRYNRDGDVIGQQIKVKLTGKLQAIDMLMKHFGMYAPEEHNVNVGMDWDKLFKEAEQKTNRIDVIEGEIAKIENQKD